MKNTTAIRYHDISAGHRVVGHENKCAHLHGHNYRVWFYCKAAELDYLGRVLDFSVIKSKLCMWLEDNWDHKMLIYEHDPLLPQLQQMAPDDIVVVPFNPTAELIAQYIVEDVAIDALAGTGVVLWKVVIEETRKCSASYER